MYFKVKLLELENFSEVNGFDMFAFLRNTRHISGKYFCFEGDVEGLSGVDPIVHVEGVTECHGDMQDKQFFEYCRDVVFCGFDFGEYEPGWGISRRDHPISCVWILSSFDADSDFWIATCGERFKTEPGSRPTICPRCGDKIKKFERR